MERANGGTSPSGLLTSQRSANRASPPRARPNKARGLGNLAAKMLQFFGQLLQYHCSLSFCRPSIAELTFSSSTNLSIKRSTLASIPLFQLTGLLFRMISCEGLRRERPADFWPLETRR
jgi:hypothetical protein